MTGQTSDTATDDAVRLVACPDAGDASGASDDAFGTVGSSGVWSAATSTLTDADPPDPLIAGKNFATHSLAYLGTTWDQVGDPSGEVGGCWRHTFRVSGFGVHAERNEYDGADEYRLGFTRTNFAETFSASEVTVRGVDASTVFGDGDGGSDYLYDGPEVVATGARRDESLTGFLKPNRFVNRLNGGQPLVSDDAAERLARALFREEGVGMEVEYDQMNLSEFEARLARHEAIEQLVGTGGTVWLGTLVGAAGLTVDLAYDLGKSVLKLLDAEKAEPDPVAFDEGLEIGYDHRADHLPAAGHHVLFDVYTSPCSRGLVEVESSFGSEEYSASWVLDLGEPDWDSCGSGDGGTDANGNARLLRATGDEDVEASAPPGLREAAPAPSTRPVPAATTDASGSRSGDAEAEPVPLLAVREDGDRYVLDASDSTASSGQLAEYAFQLERTHPDAATLDEIHTEEPTVCVELDEPANYRASVEVAEVPPGRTEPVWSDGAAVEHFVVGGTSARIAAPADGATVATDETITLDATATVFADGPSGPGAGSPQVTWRLLDGAEVVWTHSTDALVEDVEAAELFGSLGAGDFTLELRVDDGTTRSRDVVLVTHEPTLVVDLPGPDGDLLTGEPYTFAAEVAGDRGSPEFDWELTVNGLGPFSRSGDRTFTFESIVQGTHEVTVIVDDGHETARASTTFGVDDDFTVSLEAPSDPKVGDQPTFEPEVTGAADTMEYDWEYRIGESEWYPAPGDETLTLDPFDTAGRRAVRVSVSGGGTTKSDTCTFTVEERDLSVSLEEPPNPELGTSHTFDPTVVGASGDVSYDWERSVDGGTTIPVDADDTLELTFGSPVQQTITVTVTDDAGDEASASTSFTVESASTLRAALPDRTTVEAGERLELSPTVYGADGDLEYTWRVDGDEVGSDATLSTTFPSPGSHTVTLTVAGGGETAHASTTLEVTEAVPDLEADVVGAPSTVTVGDTVTVEADVTGGEPGYDHGWAVVPANTNQGAEATGSGESFEHRFGSTGTFEVRLSVRDGSGQSDDATATIEVEEAVPELSASVEGAPSSVTEGATVTVRAGVEGGEPEYTYDWAVVPESTNSGRVGQGSGSSFRHTFSSPGTYEVQLTVRGSAGGSDDASATIDVEEDVADLSASIAGAPSEVTVGETASVEADVTGGKPGFEYGWSLVPESTNRGTQQDTGSSYRPEFRTAGQHTIQLSVSDASGQRDDAEATVTAVEDTDGGSSGGSDGGSSDGGSSDGGSSDDDSDPYDDVPDNCNYNCGVYL